VSRPRALGKARCDGRIGQRARILLGKHQSRSDELEEVGLCDRGLDSPNMKKIAISFAIVAMAYAGAPPYAAAYIDPLSGSIVFQVLAAGFFAAYLSIKRFRDYLRGSLRSLVSRLRR
jgi:hypothetical protein